jgi:large subunit ribosomal protein L32
VICPKYRSSKARTRSRKANWRLKAPNLSPCPSCRELKLPHVACQKCGYYNGRLVIEIKEKKRKRR